MSDPLPSFHDGYLIGVRLEDKQVAFRLKRYNGEEWEVIASELQALRMDDFREGNIISTFEIVCGSRPQSDDLERLFDPPHSSAERKYHEMHARFVETKSQAVEAREATLLVITPSYGAEVLALAGDVAVAPFLRSLADD